VGGGGGRKYNYDPGMLSCARERLWGQPIKPVKLHGMDKMGFRRMLSLDDESHSYSMIPLLGVARDDLSPHAMGNQPTPLKILTST
jgi:hypothetical protein